jgi:hypothetical protein
VGSPVAEQGWEYRASDYHRDAQVPTQSQDFFVRGFVVAHVGLSRAGGTDSLVGITDIGASFGSPATYDFPDWRTAFYMDILWFTVGVVAHESSMTAWSFFQLWE